MRNNQPKVTLINPTSHPLHQLAWAFGIYKGITPPDLLSTPEHIRAWMKKKGAMESELHHADDYALMTEFCQPFLKDPTATGLEYIQMAFLIENVSRAFQQQLTRHRMASYIIQSLRVFDLGKFATEGRYTMPSTVKNETAYHEEMLNIQGAYNEAIKAGENVEDARGLLPLNVHSTITMRVDFSQLRHILRGRLCLTAQEEARKVGYQFKQAVTDGMGKFFGDLLQPPCHAIYGGKCTNTPNYCGVPLWLASTAPDKFKAWYNEHDGQPDNSRIPTNSTILPEDLEQVEIALAEASR
jgi:thymidylate synthase (FAD)